MGIFLGEAEARRKILRGRKTITRRYYRKFSLQITNQLNYFCVLMRKQSILGGTAIPAWSISVICGLSMLIVGGGLFFLLKKLVVDSVEESEVPSYQPAMQDDV